MSEGQFIATAQILVRPNTSQFRVDLEKQLQTVLARPVRIPVVPVVAPAAFAGAVAGTAAFSAAQAEAAASTAITADALATATTISRQYAGAMDLSAISTKALVVAQEQEVVAANAAAAAQARTQAGVTKGIVAQGASLLGLRAGTLAASSAFIGGTVAVLAFSKAVQSAASLETELNVFRTTAGATADGFRETVGTRHHFAWGDGQRRRRSPNAAFEGGSVGAGLVGRRAGHVAVGYVGSDRQHPGH